MTNMKTSTNTDTKNMSQKHRMLSNMFYEHLDDALTKERNRAAGLTRRLNQMPEEQVDERRVLLNCLAPWVKDVKSNPPSGVIMAITFFWVTAFSLTMTVLSLTVTPSRLEMIRCSHQG